MDDKDRADRDTVAPEVGRERRDGPCSTGDDQGVDRAHQRVAARATGSSGIVGSHPQAGGNRPLGKKRITQERLRELLHYDPETGVFTWIATKARRIRNGEEAGSIVTIRGTSLKYRIINVDYMPTAAHRLAWLYMTGELPSQVDHRDLDGLNNGFLNLRKCSDTQNRANQRTTVSNRSGFKGVSWSAHAKRWRATLAHNHKQIHLGYYASPEDAHAAYAQKAKEVFGEFARER